MLAGDGALPPLRTNMINEYLLPCSCGRANPVGIRQAGETIQCACGTTLDVPTMRELRRLEPSQGKTNQPQTVWGPRQGLVFLGLLLAVMSLAACGYVYFVRMPTAPDLTTPQAQLDAIKPVDAWRYWGAVRGGIPAQPMADVAELLYRTQKARTEIRIALGFAVAGLALAASGLLVKPKRV
jgi:hypothetical protein